MSGQTLHAAPSARSFPTGTVTFLFTDIEGSTRLVHELGTARWQPILERHRALLREAIAAAGGVEVQTDGDGLFAVFARPPAAVAAVAAAQRALHAEPWPEGVMIRVRMGLHSGEGSLDADGAYVGPDVHRAARIAAAGHGGQVVLSEATCGLVADALPAGVHIADLGRHRLKDLRAERLAELLIDGLPADFPPIRSLDARPNNLPVILTSFVGRADELKAAADLLAETRLLTLSGPGGTGKTRLALQIAALTSDRFPDGIWFVPLEPIRDRALVVPTIAHTIGLKSGHRSDLEMIAEHVGKKRMLFVLDNFEQVVDAGPALVDLLKACPELRMLVTSRAVLRVSGEQEFPVPGLPAPPDVSRLSHLDFENLPPELQKPAVEALGHYEAVRLFIARAVAVRPSFSVTNDNAPAVAQICARLGGMPLAIELAAARVKLLSPDQILSRIEDQLSLLTSGSRDLPERQQTLRGAISWSYDLLGDYSRAFFDRLSIFVGGFEIEDAETVCPVGLHGLDLLDGIAALVDQSLVRRDERYPETRFDIFPTIREFAFERLTARGEADQMAERHARHFLALAERARPQLSGADQRTWLDKLEREHDNLRAALDWLTEKPEPALAARLAFDLWRFWQQRGYLNEARARLDRMDAMNWPLAPADRGRFYEALGGIAYWQADHPGTVRAYDAALAAWREAGDKKEIANALYNRAYADILPELVKSAVVQPDMVRAAERCDEALALFREVGDKVGEANILWARGSIHFFLNQIEEAEPWFRQSLAAFRATEHRTMEAWARHMLGATLLKKGDSASAAILNREALQHFHAAGDLSGVTLALDDLAAVAIVEGDAVRAGRLHGAAQKLGASTGTELARYVEEEMDEAGRPSARRLVTRAEIEKHRGEGAAMTLDQAVAYALAPAGKPMPAA
ncbi:MAG: tetratricopeptide repeat protein [Bauldia sp.]|nr:tetratricopeptide repeat protein [Bauldia sp.]